MSEFKKGDEVLIKAVVFKNGVAADGDVFFKASSSGHVIYVTPEDCTLIDPGEFKVGDRVKTGSFQGVIESLPKRYVVRSELGNWGTFAPEQLTKLPPELTHCVEYHDDTLFLFESVTNEVRSKVSMEDPIEVEQAIVRWSNNCCQIDADEVRKLIAVPTVLHAIELAQGFRCIAVRLVDGWVARIGGNESSLGDFGNFGFAISEEYARKLFPEVNGPYKE